ncbi:uncharacterized protein [Argopecten irradians]|uniref:uncharacterized protein isoform X2 n=1 Tax=Argopecten irradians TaxID=31199 RepID=UPI003720DC25
MRLRKCYKISILAIVSLPFWIYIYRYIYCQEEAITLQDKHELIQNQHSDLNKFYRRPTLTMDLIGERLLQTSLGHHSPVNLNMTEKARYVNRMCRHINWQKRTVKSRHPVFFFSEQAGLLACKAPKTGSTLIGALFRAINMSGEKNVSKVFQLGRNKIHKGLDEIRDQLITEDIIESTSHVMVTRDPYSRLYSAFIDKYFLLGRLGRDLAIHLKRGFKEGNGTYCGYDYTFQDFLDYVIHLATNMVEMNEHMVPVSQLCDVCNVRYDLISSQEKLTKDTDQILKLIKTVSIDRLEVIRKSIKSQQSTLLSLVSSYIFDYNNNKNDCPDKMAFSAKLWKTFQVQGIVHSELVFPENEFSQFSFHEREAANMTSAILTQIKYKPLSSPERDLQRRRYLVKAYSGITWPTIAKLQNIYRLDIALFGYPSYPPTII